MSRQSVLGPVELTSLTKKERGQLQDLGLSILGKVGDNDADGDKWFERITFQARKPCTDEEIRLSSWDPGVVA